MTPDENRFRVTLDTIVKNTPKMASVHQAARSLQNPTLTTTHPRMLTKTYFADPVTQIVRTLLQNYQADWGKVASDFINLPEPPDMEPFEKDPLVALVLVPYLSSLGVHFTGTDGCERTFNALWTWLTSILQTQVGKPPCRTERVLSGYTSLRYAMLPEFKFRWEIIHLGAEVGREPFKCSGFQLAHAGVLAAACQHPYWLRSMNGGKTPFVFLSGYSANVLGQKTFTHTPSLRFEWNTSLAAMDFEPNDTRHSRTANPTIIKMLT